MCTYDRYITRAYNDRFFIIIFEKRWFDLYDYYKLCHLNVKCSSYIRAMSLIPTAACTGLIWKPEVDSFQLSGVCDFEYTSNHIVLRILAHHAVTTVGEHENYKIILNSYIYKVKIN